MTPVTCLGVSTPGLSSCGSFASFSPSSASLAPAKAQPHTLPCFLWVQLYEVQFDRTGGFTGVKLGMSLKGHKSKVFSLDFSPDLTKASDVQ